jgi:CRP-like cAMP-binding protein
VQFGCVRTYAQFNKGRRLVIGFYFPGDYFGLEMGKKHGFSADVMVPSMILVIGKRTLMSRAMNNIAVAKRMLDITHVELQRAQNHSLLLRRSAEERVAQFLFDMKKRNRRKELDLFMSRQDIADHLNLTIESVSRVFTRLEKASAISFLTHRRVAVHIRKPIAA